MKTAKQQTESVGEQVKRIGACAARGMWRNLHTGFEPIEPLPHEALGTVRSGNHGGMPVIVIADLGSGHEGYAERPEPQPVIVIEPRHPTLSGYLRVCRHCHTVYFEATVRDWPMSGAE